METCRLVILFRVMKQITGFGIVVMTYEKGIVRCIKNITLTWLKSVVFLSETCQLDHVFLFFSFII